MQELTPRLTNAFRKRASRACVSCRSRKVRCDVIHRPHQCTNCALDGVQCVVKDRRTRYRKRSPVQKPRIQFRNQFLQPKSIEITAPNPASPNGTSQEPALSEMVVEDSPMSPSTCFQDIWNQPEIEATMEGLTQGHSEDSDKGSSTSERATDRCKQTDLSVIPPSPGTNQTESIPSFNMRPCSNTELTGQSHILYSYYPFLDLDISGLSPDDINYLEVQGCFRVPTREALDDFVKEYFLHVHPGLPLLDEAWFWDIYARPIQARCRSTLSLFVFQSMLFAACGFLPFSTLRSLGFTSMRNARDTYYRRSKLLFDLCGERNLIPCSQGALLLSYNGTMKDQKPANSIWLATAIHLAHAAGADQFYTRLNQYSTAVIELKRLWWCCIVRDRILPLGVRRQLHIACLDLAHENYFLTEKDFSREIEESRVYASQTKRTLVSLFITLCELAVPLTDVIKTVYDTGWSTDIQSPVVRDVQQSGKSLRSCEAGLEAWFDKATIQFPTPAGIVSTEESLVLFTNLMYIYYHAARFALYQHEAFVISRRLTGDVLDDKLRQTRREMEDATRGITENLKELIQLKLGKFLPISIVAYIALPLILHILDVKLAKRPSQTAQKQGRLNVYMETMKGMQNLYDGVDDVWTFIRTVVDYATVEGADSETRLQNLHDISRVECLELSSPLNKAANDWGNVLIKEPVLYFRLSRTIDLSLALGRYSEDSSLGLSQRLARLPSPQLLLIDMDQTVHANNHDFNITSAIEDNTPEDVEGQFSLTSQMLDEFFTYDFSVNHLQTPIQFNESELSVEEVNISIS